MKILKKAASLFIRILFSTPLHLLIIYRTSRLLCIKFPCSRKFIIPCARHLMRIYTSCDISPEAVIGKRFSMPHPLGIVVGDGVIIGDNVKIWQHTTIGSHGRKGEKLSYPTIGNRVRMYAGSTIIGGVTVGDDAVIGAHSLVTIDVPAAQTAVGCPAVILKRKDCTAEC